MWESRLSGSERGQGRSWKGKALVYSTVCSGGMLFRRAGMPILRNACTS